jgi:hypothetical protein
MSTFQFHPISHCTLQTKFPMRSRRARQVPREIGSFDVSDPTEEAGAVLGNAQTEGNTQIVVPFLSFEVMRRSSGGMNRNDKDVRCCVAVSLPATRDKKSQETRE